MSAAPEQAAGALSPSRSALLRTGLVHGAWVTTRKRGHQSPTPSAEEFTAAGFTTPTYYEQPLYDTGLQGSAASHTWAVAHAPKAGAVTGPPQAGEQVLSGQQLADRERLYAVQFALLRQQAPGVLVHNNQAPHQWTEAQLRTYTRVAKPDLLTFDDYYFSTQTGYPGGSVTPMYNALHLYRKLALEGVDGSGRSPIQFGQYTLGFRTGDKPSDGGSYIISESQQNLVPNAVWAMGGTWLTMFRWWKGWSQGLVDTGRDGRRTPQFDRYRAINHTMAALSPHLTRLRSTDIRLIRGQHRALGAAVTNPPSNIPAWSRGAGDDAAITDITVNNRGKTNDGLPRRRPRRLLPPAGGGSRPSTSRSSPAPTPATS